MLIYGIPVWERYVEIGRGPFLKERCLCIDNVGLFVRYYKEEQLTAYNIRRRLIFRRRTRCLVEADNPGKALGILRREWEGMGIGGERKISKALRINEEEEILEYPYCGLLRKSKRDDFICGEEMGKNNNGEFGMCVLDGCDSPFEECPISSFMKCVRNAREDNSLIIARVRNYKIIKSEQFRFAKRQTHILQTNRK